MTARLATYAPVASRTPHVLARLRAAGVDVEFVGGDGVFGDARRDPLTGVREGTLDLALVGIRALRGSAADDLATVAVLPRDEPRDVLLPLAGPRRPLAEIAAGCRVAVVGARRAAFLAAHRPDLEVVLIELQEMAWLLTDDGSPDADLGAGRPDAVIVSALDARHAGRAETAVEALEPKSWLPEPGQGAVALIARHPIAEATAIDHLPTRTALRTELALLDALDTEDGAPLGCLAQPSGRWIRLWAAAASGDGRRLVRSDLTGPLDEPEALGASVARQLVERGYGLVVGGALP